MANSAGEAQPGLHVVAVDAADNRDYGLTDVDGKAGLDVAITPIEWHVRRAGEGESDFVACEVLRFEADARRLIVVR